MALRTSSGWHCVHRQLVTALTKSSDAWYVFLYIPYNARPTKSTAPVSTWNMVSVISSLMWNPTLVMMWRPQGTTAASTSSTHNVGFHIKDEITGGMSRWYVLRSGKNSPGTTRGWFGKNCLWSSHHVPLFRGTHVATYIHALLVAVRRWEPWFTWSCLTSKNAHVWRGGHGCPLDILIWHSRILYKKLVCGNRF